MVSFRKMDGKLIVGISRRKSQRVMVTYPGQHYERYGYVESQRSPNFFWVQIDDWVPTEQWGYHWSHLRFLDEWIEEKWSLALPLPIMRANLPKVVPGTESWPRPLTSGPWSRASGSVRAFLSFWARRCRIWKSTLIRFHNSARLASASRMAELITSMGQKSYTWRVGARKMITSSTIVTRQSCNFRRGAIRRRWSISWPRTRST